MNTENDPIMSTDNTFMDTLEQKPYIECGILATIAIISGVLYLSLFTHGRHDDFVKCVITIGLALIGQGVTFLVRKPWLYVAYFAASVVLLPMFASAVVLYHYSIPATQFLLFVGALCAIVELIQASVFKGAKRLRAKRILHVSMAVPLLIQLIAAVVFMSKSGGR